MSRGYILYPVAGIALVSLGAAEQAGHVELTGCQEPFECGIRLEEPPMAPSVPLYTTGRTVTGTTNISSSFSTAPSFWIQS